MSKERRDKSSVLLIDDLTLRRTQTTSWLTEWARENDLKLVGMTPSEANEVIDVSNDFELVIFSVGGKTLNEPVYIRPVRLLHALCPEVPFVIFSDLEDNDEILAAVDCGALGYLPSTIDPDLALRTLTFILGGGSYFPPSAIQKIHQHQPPSNSSNGGKAHKSSNGSLKKTDSSTPDRDPEDTDSNFTSNVNGTLVDMCTQNLTQRQEEVLHCLREGQPNKVIARSLGMTEATVKVHVRDVMRKLGVHNRTQAALWRPEDIKSGFSRSPH